jgi:hypothetical protein
MLGFMEAGHLAIEARDNRLVTSGVLSCPIEDVPRIAGSARPRSRGARSPGLNNGDERLARSHPIVPHTPSHAGGLQHAGLCTVLNLGRECYLNVTGGTFTASSCPPWRSFAAERVVGLDVEQLDRRFVGVCDASGGSIIVAVPPRRRPRVL